MAVKLIAAVDDKFGIGRNGEIPWDVPADGEHFNRMTMGCTVLMGKTTYDGIGKPLAGRRNIVITRGDAKIDGVEVEHDVEAALKLDHDIWVIGGAAIYEATLDFADEIHLTNIPGDYNCDRFFPSIDHFDGLVVHYRFD